MDLDLADQLQHISVLGLWILLRRHWATHMKKAFCGAMTGTKERKRKEGKRENVKEGGKEVRGGTREGRRGQGKRREKKGKRR